MSRKKSLSLVVLTALFVFLHAPRAESFFSSGFSFSAGSGTMEAGGSGYTGSSWGTVSSSSAAVSENSGSASIFASAPVSFSSVSEAEGILSPEIMGILNGLEQEASISAAAVTADNGLAALVGGEDVLQSLLLQNEGNTVTAQKVTTLHTNGVQYKEITKFSELLNADAGDRDYQIYNIKGTEIYYWAFASADEWETTFERLDCYVEGYYNDETYEYVSGNVVSDDILSDESYRDYVLGLDYDIRDVARFFTAVENLDGSRQIELAADEIKFRDDLLNMGLLTEQNGVYESPDNAAVISLNPSEMETIIQTNTVEHELNHALYFTDPEYKDEVRSAWNSLPSSEQELAREELEDYYDVDDEDLLIREYAAWCGTHQGDNGIFRNYHSQQFRDIYREYRERIF